MQERLSTKRKETAKGDFSQVQPKAEGIIKEKRKPHYSSMNDDELIAEGKAYCAEKGIKTPRGLFSSYQGLYDALRRRGILYQVMPRQNIYWCKLSDPRLLEETNKVVAAHSITSRSQLAQQHGALYRELSERDLLKNVLDSEKRAWGTDDELVAKAEQFCSERGIRTFGELHDADDGMLQALARRGLKKRIFAGSRKIRRWCKMGDDEIVRHAREFCEQRSIRNTKQLKNADKGLLAQIDRRGLLAKVLADYHPHRRWRKVKDEELFAIVQKFCDEHGITTPIGLLNSDYSLYQTARKRGLMSRLFPERAHDATTLIDAIEKFGE